MSEAIVECRIFELRYLCDEVKVGGTEKCGAPMNPLDGPPMQVGAQMLFKHRCRACKGMKFLPGVFPQQMLLPVGEPIPEQWKKILRLPAEKKIELAK